MAEIDKKLEYFIPRYVRYLAFSVFVSVNFFNALEITIQAPFYPAEAEKKNATSTEYGIVFGVFELVVFIVSPIVPSMLEKIGFYTTFNMGLGMVGVCTVLYGFLDRVNDHTFFIIFSIILRIIAAIGTCMSRIASYTLIVKYFPGSTATAFSIFETAFALGNAAGPLIGGILYKLGGFTLPFLMLGACVAIGILSSSIIFSREKNFSPKTRTKAFGFFTLLQIPVFFLYSLNVMIGALAAGFLLTTLEPYLRQFNLDPVEVGFVFLAYTGVYALTAALWGTICDRVKNPEYILFISLILMAWGYLWIGPVSWIPYEPSLWLIVVSLSCFGLGLAGTYVSVFVLMIRVGKHVGEEKYELAPYVYSLWVSSLCFGSFIGPTLAGVLYLQFGFRLATVFVVAAFKFFIVLAVVRLIFPKLLDRRICQSRSLEPKEKHEEILPLLPRELENKILYIEKNLIQKFSINTVS